MATNPICNLILYLLFFANSLQINAPLNPRGDVVTVLTSVDKKYSTDNIETSNG